jgi:EpsI family protein
MHARLGPRSEPVSYWMLLGDQPVADDAAWRWRQLRHGLQGRILDGLLVRVSTIDAEGPRAWGEHLRFADELLAALPPEGRTLLLGRA